MSAGMAGGKLLMIVGAGAAGSYVFNNPYISDIFRDVAKVIIKHLKDDGGRKGDGSEEGGQSSDSSTAALTAQVRRLSQELRQLATISSRPVVISNGSDKGGGFVSFIIPAAVLGIAGYGYMWWKGIGFGDLMYVTKRGMNQAVKNFNEQMGTLSTALASAKKQLAGRIDNVSKTLTDSVQVQLAIKKDVSNVYKAVSSVDGEVKSLQGNVQSLEGKIDDIQQSSVITAKGIVLLCHFVTQNFEGRQGLKLEVEQLSRLASSAASARPITYPSSSRSTSTTSSSSVGLNGLKDLHTYLQEELETVAPLMNSTPARRMIGVGGTDLDSLNSTPARRMIGMGSTDLDSQSSSNNVGAASVHRSLSSTRIGDASASLRMDSSSDATPHMERVQHPRSSVQLVDHSDEDYPHATGGQRRPEMRPEGRPEVYNPKPVPARSDMPNGPPADLHSTESSFTEDDIPFPPRRPGAPVISSRSQRMFPPLNFNV